MSRKESILYKENINLYFLTIISSNALSEYFILSDLFKSSYTFQYIAILFLCIQIFLSSNYELNKIVDGIYLFNLISLSNSIFLLYVYCINNKNMSDDTLYSLSIIVFSVLYGYHISKLYFSKKIGGIIIKSVMFINTPTKIGIIIFLILFKKLDDKYKKIIIKSLYILFYITITVISIIYIAIGLLKFNSDVVSILGGGILSVILAKGLNFNGNK